MGGLADRGGEGRGPAAVAADARHALRDPALHPARPVAARLPAPQGRARPAAIHYGGHVHPRDTRAAPATLLVDQRTEGHGRAKQHAVATRVATPDTVYRP